MPTLRLRFPSNKTLGNICVYGAIASVSAVMYMHWKFVDRIRNTDYFRLAFQTLRQHKGAVGLLGEPIKDTGFDLSNTNNVCDAQNAHFEVNVRGSKDKGKMYFWATSTDQNGWLIDRLELETNQHPNKRFLLKKSLETSIPVVHEEAASQNTTSKQSTENIHMVTVEANHTTEKLSNNAEQPTPPQS